MEITVKNREWVKNAAIIFLAVLLVLTFFSNTIMNRTLAEVATAPVNSGSIVAKVRGTGKVTANGSTEIKMKQTRAIKAVKVKVGEAVKAGDVLFVLGEGDSKELEEAQEKLRQLELSYKRGSINYPTMNFASQDNALAIAEKAYLDAEKAEKEAWDKYNETVTGNDGDKISEEIKHIDSLIDELNYQIETLQTEFTETMKNVNRYEECDRNVKDTQALVDVLKNEENPPLEEISEYGGYINDWKAEMAELQPKLPPDTYTYTETVNSQLANLRSKRDELVNSKYTLQNSIGNLTYYEAALEATRNAESLYQAYLSAYSSADSAYSSFSKSAAVSSLDLQDIQYQIDRQKEIVDKLSGAAEDSITASVGGTIMSLSATAGQTVQADTVLCTIEVEDMGYTVSFSVTNDQAQRLRIGDTATVSNYYWGRQTIATLTTIRNDPKSPMTNKLLTFDLDGDVNSGSDITISVGSKSANYDHVIPSSAIRSDSNGSFVLAIEARNSPLGNRYTAKRVSVEVLASDDENSAVNGALENGDFVITTSNSPIKSGDMVRMADNA